MTSSSKEHWNKVYTNNPITQLGWHEAQSFPSVQLIERCAVPKHYPTILKLQNAAVWHDRAVFHFLTQEQHRQTYHSLLQKIVMPGGFVIMATFAMDGATKCSGLPVKDTVQKA